MNINRRLSYEKQWTQTWLIIYGSDATQKCQYREQPWREIRTKKFCTLVTGWQSPQKMNNIRENLTEIEIKQHLNQGVSIHTLLQLTTVCHISYTCFVLWYIKNNLSQAKLPSFVRWGDWTPQIRQRDVSLPHQLKYNYANPRATHPQWVRRLVGGAERNMLSPRNYVYFKNV